MIKKLTITITFILIAVNVSYAQTGVLNSPCGNITLTSASPTDDKAPINCGVSSSAIDIEFYIEITQTTGSIDLVITEGATITCNLVNATVGQNCLAVASSPTTLTDFIIDCGGPCVSGGLSYDIIVYFNLPPATPTPTTYNLPTSTIPFIGSDSGYAAQPTPISTIDLPPINLSTPPSVPPFSFPTPNVPPTPTSSLPPINTTLNISLITPSPLNYNPNQFQEIINFSESLSTTFSVAESQIDTISQSMHIFINGNGDQITNTTGISVPVWYVPSMPDEIRQIGWDFETMGTDLRRRYGLFDWINFFLSFIIIIVQFIKGLFYLAVGSGPLGLFLIWLFIMAPIVLAMRGLIYAEVLIITVFNIILRMFRFIISWIPGVG